MVQGKEKKGREHIGERLTHTYIQKEKREKKNTLEVASPSTPSNKLNKEKKKPRKLHLEFFSFFFNRFSAVPPRSIPFLTDIYFSSASS